MDDRCRKCIDEHVFVVVVKKCKGYVSTRYKYVHDTYEEIHRVIVQDRPLDGVFRTGYVRVQQTI